MNSKNLRDSSKLIFYPIGELALVWDMLSFNRRWKDSRILTDIETMDLLLFLYGFAGLRKMEAANIKISGVDFIKNEILLPGKWGKVRLVPIPQELADKLKDWIENLCPESDLPYVVVGNQGSQLSDKSIGCRFTHLSKTIALNKAIDLIKARETQPGATKETIQYTPEDDIELFFPSRSKEAVLKEAEQLAKTLNCTVRPTI